MLVDADDDTQISPSTEPTSATIGLAVLVGNTSHHGVLFDNVVVDLP